MVQQCTGRATRGQKASRRLPEIRRCAEKSRRSAIVRRNQGGVGGVAGVREMLGRMVAYTGRPDQREEAKP